MELYDAEDYRLQCAILNHLHEILIERNCGQIRQFVESIRSSVPAVQGNIDALLAACRKIQKT